MPEPLSKTIEAQDAKIKALKDDRLRLSDNLIDVMVERALSEKALRALVEATTQLECVVCHLVQEEGSEWHHMTGCAWYAAYKRVSSLNEGS